MLAAAVLVLVPSQVSVVEDTFREDERILSGRVTSPQGAPIADAGLELRMRLPGASRLIGQASSAADGRFSMRVDPGPSDHIWRDSFLEVSASGWAPCHLERVYLPPPSYDLGPIVLHPPVELRGRVVDGAGGPVAGATIHAALGPVCAPHGDHARRQSIATTDERGEFECRSLPPGLVTLGAGAEGYADLMLAPVVLRPEGPNHVEFKLYAERPVRVQVLSREGTPLPRAVAAPMGDVPDVLWDRQDRYQAFWREGAAAEDTGWITLHGLDASFVGDVIVTAPDHRPEQVRIRKAELEVRLEPVTWIEVVAASRDGGPPPELFEVGIRDGTRPRSFCGNCEDTRWVHLWAHSPAVERLTSDRWRIAWNSPGCHVDGGDPESVTAITTDETHASLELDGTIEPGSRVECRLEFEPPARLSGIVREASGLPVSVRLGIQLSFYGSGWLATTSGPDGRFTFERIGSGSQWLYSLDDRWEVDDDCDRVELVAGQSLEGVTVLVHPHPEGRSGRATGVVTIGGAPPGEPVLLALDEVPNQHLPGAYPRGFAWTDAQGEFEIGAFWPRQYHLVPKHRPAPDAGGWRDFAAEFPAHDSGWKWTVSVPDEGRTTARIELPSESEWDQLAPPERDADD